MGKPEENAYYWRVGATLRVGTNSAVLNLASASGGIATF